MLKNYADEASEKTEYEECSRLIHKAVTDKDSNVRMYYGYIYGNVREKTHFELQAPSGNTKYNMHMLVDEISNIIRIED